RHTRLRPPRVLTRRVLIVQLIFASRYTARATVWKSFEIAGIVGAMAADTLARMFWDCVEKSAGRPAQSFKQVPGWKTVRWRESEAAHKSTLAERVTTTGPADLATIVYTSGTTGPPKGVLQTHANHIAAVSASKQRTPVEEGWVHLLFLPLAHSFARLESFLG